MALQLSEIFDASEDSLQLALTELCARPASAKQQEMLQAIHQEIAERESFSSMDNALHCLFNELGTPEQTYPRAASPSHAGFVVPAEEPEVEVFEAVHQEEEEADLEPHVRDGHAPDAELSETFHMAPEFTQEAGAKPDTTIVDVAAAARTAFNAERRKAGHARKALKCPTRISTVDTPPPPAKEVARKPAVPSFRAPVAKCQLKGGDQAASDTSAPLEYSESVINDIAATSCCQENGIECADACPSGTGLSTDTTRYGADTSATAVAQALERERKNASGESSGSGKDDNLITSSISVRENSSAHSTSMHNTVEATCTTLLFESHEDAVLAESCEPGSAPVTAQMPSESVGEPDYSLGCSHQVTDASTADMSGSGTDEQRVQSHPVDTSACPSGNGGDSAEWETCMFIQKNTQEDMCNMAKRCASSDQLSQHVEMSSSSTVRQEVLISENGSSLVLEDSYAGSLASDNSDTAAGVSDDEVVDGTSAAGVDSIPLVGESSHHISFSCRKGRFRHLDCNPADLCTHIALAKTHDAKMTVPSWSTFQAVAALSTDEVGYRAGVSSWEGVNVATGPYLGGACTATSGHSQKSEPGRSQIAPSRPNKGKFNDYEGSYIISDPQDVCQKAEHAYKARFPKRSNKKNRDACSPGLIKALHEKTTSSATAEDSSKIASPGPAKDVAMGPSQEPDEEPHQLGDTKHSAILTTHSVSKVIEQILLPPLQTALNEPGCINQSRRSEGLPVEHGRQAPFPAPGNSTKESGQQQGISPVCNPDRCSKQASHSALRTCSRERAQLHSPYAHPDGGNSMKHSLSMEDLTRNNIPVLPQVYTNLFPSFLATLALYWKPPANAVQVRNDHEKVMRGEQSILMLNDILDTALERCNAWCKQNQQHGEALPGWAVIPKGQDSRPGSKCSSRHAHSSVLRCPPDSARPPSGLCNTFTTSSLDSAAQQVAGTGGPGWHYRGENRIIDPFKVVAVPGWVPQLSNGRTQQKFFRIIAGEHPEVEDLVGGVLRDMGWLEDSDVEASGSDGCGNGCHLWNLCWTWTVRAKVPESKLFAWQRINHFQECRHLTRKDLLSHHLQRCAAKFRNSRHADVFQCLPTTYVLPKEFGAFEEAFTQATKPAAASKHVYPEQKAGLNIWIMKPSSLSRGRGIYLVDDISGAVCSQPSVVQRYIADPYLYQGYKFDLRLYVVVTSFNPLESFLYKEGFARFALEVYTNDAKQRGNSFVHLTNSSIQEENPTSCQNLPQFLAADKHHKAGGSKMSLSRLWPLLKDQGLDMTLLWERLCSATLAALYSAQDAIPSQATAFELYGVDAMLDRSGKVWLLEVNASPSLATNTELDKEIKGDLLQDVINLVDPVPFDRVALKHVLSRRQQQRTGPARRSRRQGGGLLSGTEAEEREVMNTDLHAILKGSHPRVVGTMPQRMGKFQCIAPSPLLQQFHRSGN